MSVILRQQCGTALVTVLLAVALLMLSVVEFTYSTQVDYHLAHNALKVLQAACLARSGVNVARLALQNDVETSGLDFLGEDWARAVPPLPAGHGLIVVRIADEQGKLNLNALRNANGTINSPWREITERLFELRGVDVGLLDPVLDWLDGDDFPEPRGAEKNQYQNRIPPLPPRNGPFLTLGELGRVEGITPALQARLSEVVTVLPSTNTRINVNTAPADVLAALFPMLDHETLGQFLTARIDSPVHGTNELRERLAFPVRTAPDTLRLTTVRSAFFSIHALATVAPISQALKVIVRRRGATVTPISWQPVTPARG